jgi:epoxyqueuosine reductase
MRITNEIVIHKARELGFDLIGFAPALKLEKEIEHLKEWNEKGLQASMEYMNRNIEKRSDINEILPGAKSVISLGMNYYTPGEYDNREGFGKVSRYAWGKDYHLEIWDKLEELEEELRNMEPLFESKSYVDTGPVMDKVWAVHSGIGWLGKHSNVISREIGSWFFIANIISKYEFDYTQAIADFCGSCSACIDACPTKAIVQPYIVDANKCISFLTIENKENINSSFKDKLDGWLFGCDICQDVCPWNNKFSLPSNKEVFSSRNKELELENILEMDEISFKEKFETSPIKRTKLSGLKRNAEFLLDRIT